MLPDSYLEILGCDEPSTQAEKRPLDNEEEIEQLILDKQRTLSRAMKAATDGDAEEAADLFRLHSKMVIQPPVKTTQPVKGEVSKPTTDLTSEDLGVDDEKPFVENGITFMPGK